MPGSCCGCSALPPGGLIHFGCCSCRGVAERALVPALPAARGEPGCVSGCVGAAPWGVAAAWRRACASTGEKQRRGSRGASRSPGACPVPCERGRIPPPRAGQGYPWPGHVILFTCRRVCPSALTGGRMREAASHVSLGPGPGCPPAPSAPDTDEPCFQWLLAVGSKCCWEISKMTRPLGEAGSGLRYVRGQCPAVLPRATCNAPRPGQCLLSATPTTQKLVQAKSAVK